MENKKYSVYVRDHCLDSLDTHVAFLANVSVDAARNLVNAFWEMTNDLRTFPERNVRLQLATKPDAVFHRANLGSYHAALYEIEEDAIYMEEVLDLRQNVGLSLL